MHWVYLTFGGGLIFHAIMQYHFWWWLPLLLPISFIIAWGLGATIKHLGEKS